ncbi:hypothetical protein J6E39_05800 [bacterium]|nr:hypothetical protein [bacterium]
MIDYKEFIPNVHFELIPIKDLVSNQDYQRNLSEAHIKRAVDNFDLYQINLVKVSRRDGINYVINGQHTMEIVARKSQSNETPVWCMIYDDLEYTHEANIFANQQKYVKPLTPYDIFVANIEAGNEEQLILKALVESYNMRISKTKCHGGICAISALEYIYKTFGYQVLDQTLKLCIATWEGEVNSFGANMLKGIAKLVVAYEDELDENIFKEKLGTYSINKIVRSATERNNGSTGYAETMLDFYNKRLKTPLHKGKLKSNKFVNIPEYSVKDL